MGRRSKSPPQAIPFRRGRAEPEQAAGERRLIWISETLAQAFADQETDAYRLASGNGCGLERYGQDLLLSFRHELDRDLILAEAGAVLGRFRFQPARIYAKRMPIRAPEREAPIQISGERTEPPQTIAREAGLRYEIDFSAGYSVGLFLDQRANRQRVADLRPRRLLNTFAYTCSFSLVAARVGAETVSIDLSRRSLARGEANFRRNGVETAAAQRFVADDVFEQLPRLARRGEQFDVIVLDPPTFSRNHQGAAFQVQHDFGALLDLALGVAAPQAHLLLSVNCSELRTSDLQQFGRLALGRQRRAGRFHVSPALPDFPGGVGAKTIWLDLSD